MTEPTPQPARRAPCAPCAVTVAAVATVAALAIATGGHAAAQEPTPPAATALAAAATRLQWTYAPAGASFAAVATGGGIVFAVDRSGRAHAIDAATGTARWSTDRTFEFAFAYGLALSPDPQFAAVLVASDAGLHALDVGSQDRGVYAIDKDLGKLAWRVATGARVEAGAAPAERFVYIGSCDGSLYALDQVVGRVAWTFATEHEEGQGAPIYGCPVVLGGRVFLAAMRGTVYALDRRTGALLWQLRPVPDSELDSELVTDGERLFVASRKDGDRGTSAVVAIRAR